jgi:hypothetical protein
MASAVGRVAVPGAGQVVVDPVVVEVGAVVVEVGAVVVEVGAVDVAAPSPAPSPDEHPASGIAMASTATARPRAKRNERETVMAHLDSFAHLHYQPGGQYRQAVSRHGWP